MKHKFMFSARKALLSLTLLVAFLLPASAQIFDPVNFETETKTNEDGTIDLITRAKIDHGWKLYAQETAEDMGPVPTTFTYNLPDGVELIGATKEPEAPYIYDDVFEMNIKSFKKEAIFTQKVKITKPLSRLSGEVEFMTCDDERCLPPEIKALQWNIDASAVDTESAESKSITTSALFDIEQENGL
ncbi:MAG: protein-disulfide reductase DsbD family protein, partial [Flavobacteriaceae bacterium]|nr:protein-disulfide reductase DsbD family protein [Flavobacteriaceae bacterium]